MLKTHKIALQKNTQKQKISSTLKKANYVCEVALARLFLKIAEKEKIFE